jgi:hypothetical protein
VNKTTSPDILLLASTNIHSLTATMSSSIYATPAPSQAIERQLFDLANQVALYYAQTFHWSSFHAFNAVSQADANFESLPTDGKAIWEALISFGSCLGASTLIYHALRDAVANHAGPEVAKYADTVQLMTCAQHVSSEMQYHAIVAMCFRSFAFAIDHSLHPTAFKVPVGGEFAMFAYIPLFSNLGQERFKYYVSDSGVYMLTMDSTMITYSALAFTPQYVSTTVSQIAIPAASETKPVKGGDSDVLLPPRKYVSVHTLLNEEPKYIPSAPIHGKYLTTAIRIQIDFGEPALLIQIPRVDWLDKPQGAAWVSCIKSFEDHIENREATVHVIVKLSAKTDNEPTDREQQHIDMLCQLVEEFSIEGTVIDEMVEAIFDVWDEYRVLVVATTVRCDSPQAA